MSIDVTSTAISGGAAPVSNSKVSSAGADKTSSDTSFKDEMSKVSSTKGEKETKEVKSESKNTKSEEKTSEAKSKTSKTLERSTANKENIINTSQNNTDNSQILNGNIAINSQEAYTNANNMLQNDIAQMIENSANIPSLNNNSSVFSFSIGDKSINNFAMSETDAQFFLNLTQSNDVSARNMMTQAQNMLNSGVESKQVAQNFKVSQALLNALSEARQNNQPLRIDFDQNISVILRVGKDGAIAANFIPGDKAVEQYLRNNIESLKSSFEKQDLPYSELSYSNSSKQQNQRRRNQQGDK